MIYEKQKDIEIFESIIKWGVDLVNVNYGDVFKRTQDDCFVKLRQSTERQNLLIKKSLSKTIRVQNNAIQEINNGQKQFQIVCHRGGSGSVPENTFIAAVDAIGSGIDYLEIDISMSQDGIMYVFHGPNLKQIGVQGKIQEFKQSQLDNLDVGSIFDSQFEGQKIPRLSDFFEFVKGKIKLFLNIKAADVSELLFLIKHYEIDCFIWSDKTEVLKEIRQKNPKIDIKINVKSKAEIQKAIDNFQVDIVEISLQNMSEEIKSFCWQKGVKLMINQKDFDLKAYGEILNWGADYVNVIYGEEFRKLLGQIKL